jgi:hypothetical protein
MSGATDRATHALGSFFLSLMLVWGAWNEPEA